MRIFAALFFAFAIGMPLSAAAVLPATSPLFVTIDATPRYPGPGELVQLRGNVSGTKGQYTYVWTANGQGVAEGIDVETITLTAGGAGSATEVALYILDQNDTVRGQVFHTIRPTALDLVWEGDTYVPPLYDGRAYPNGDSAIVIEAIPHFLVNGASVARQNLVYTWEADGRKLAQQSGYGKFSLRIQPTAFKNVTTVTVTAKTQDGRVGGSAAAAIPIRTPFVVVYENKSLLGTWFQKAVQGNNFFQGEEMTFRAFPFFIGNPDAAAYTWTVGGGDPASNTRDITLRKTGDGVGTFPVTVTVQKQGSIFERASRTFELTFRE